MTDNDSSKNSTRLTLLEKEFSRMMQSVTDLTGEVKQLTEAMIDVQSRKPINLRQIAGTVLLCGAVATYGSQFVKNIVSTDVQQLKQAQLVLNDQLHSLKNRQLATQSIVTKSQVEFSSLAKIVNSNEQFKDRWYNKFQGLARDERQEGELKLLRSKIENLNERWGRTFHWKTSLKDN